MARARFSPDQLRLIVQQDKRGISEGDIVAMPGGELAWVQAVNPRAGTAELEPLGIQRGELDRAIRDFVNFAGVEADRVIRFDAKALSGPAWKLGDLCGVLYEAVLDEGSGRRKQLFFHPFKKSARPTLAVLHNGRTLATLGGAFQVGERGIVDD